MIRTLIDEAVDSGARRASACRAVGLSVRTLERWRGAHPDDAREGPHRVPANALSTAERAVILETVNSATYCDLSPHQIVPRLADAGCYLASASTRYRVLRADALLTHRGRAAVPIHRARPRHVATAPDQVWSWDITYLKSPVRGVFWYLYLVMDIWSRRIMGWAVHPAQDEHHAAALVTRICQQRALTPDGLVLHADNGGPMKGATMVSTLERLGVIPSCSRPRVSDDNPYSEALFRTLKYCPAFPTQPFADVAARRADYMASPAWLRVDPTRARSGRTCGSRRSWRRWSSRGRSRDRTRRSGRAVAIVRTTLLERPKPSNAPCDGYRSFCGAPEAAACSAVQTPV